jgi:UDP-N-acetylglucosamine 4-epimerase
VTKYVNELYAEVFANNYNFKSVGLRYFNVFGPRQNPNGAYAAVIPKWIHALLSSDKVTINGDGETSRDFCYVENVIQANILAATANEEVRTGVYNIALGDRTSLNELYNLLHNEVKANGRSTSSSLVYDDFRSGDVRHSQASIEKAKKYLGYEPTHDVKSGISSAMPWYIANLKVEA